ncbi:MAG: CoA transferase [Chloroflexi bacterium]|nr:CoA transferase [Chloroflexota bacterium]
MPTPLEGMTVLDLTENVAGPYCTKLLALYGAEVIKVEAPGVGDAARQMPPFVHTTPGTERSLVYLYLNTSKKSITLNLRSEAGRDLLRRLVPQVDVLVESFAPPTMASLGLDYQTLRELNPRLVMTSITWFGQEGPYAQLKGEEILAQALSGNLLITGEPDREPVRIGGNFAQYTGGQAAYVATMMALLPALLSGTGQHVDCSISEANSDLLDSWGINSILGTKQPRTGMHHHGGYPAELYECKDGYVAVGTGPAGWDALVEVVGREELRDPKYADPATRKSLRPEIDSMIHDWLKHTSKIEAYHAGQAKRLAFGYLMTPADMLASRQLQAREYFKELDHPATGTVKYPGPPFTYSEATWQLSRAPLLGEHNAEVYGQRLGLSPEDLQQLSQAGVL